jgi:predicted signal transduction protein with EAL and GGDEF domain
MALAKAEAALRIATDQLEVARASALHDPLTKLANRRLFDEKLANAIAVAGRHQWSLAVMFLDLDSFKAINDTQGHAGGILRCRRRHSVSCKAAVRRTPSAETEVMNFFTCSLIRGAETTSSGSWSKRQRGSVVR